MTNVSFTYKEGLEERIVSLLAERMSLSLADALDVYYRSRLAGQIASGELGVEYLSAEYLVEDLIENEFGLFKTNERK